MLCVCLNVCVILSGFRGIWMSGQQMLRECRVSVWSTAEEDRLWTCLQKQSWIHFFKSHYVLFKLLFYLKIKSVWLKSDTLTLRYCSSHIWTIMTLEWQLEKHSKYLLFWKFYWRNAADIIGMGRVVLQLSLSGHQVTSYSQTHFCRIWTVCKG